eukprot:Clim_evm2s36 gene=Clim_evmTU2s36
MYCHFLNIPLAATMLVHMAHAVPTSFAKEQMELPASVNEDLGFGSCYPASDSCTNELLKKGYYYDPAGIYALQTGTCNTTPIAIKLVEEKNNLETYILKYIGNFIWQGHGMTANDKSWWSAMFKFTSIFGPLLQAPFFDKSISVSDLSDYREELANVLTGMSPDEWPCATNATGQVDKVPYYISLGLHNGAFLPSPEPTQVQTNWWTLDYTYQPVDLQYAPNGNNSPECDSKKIAYSQSVTNTTSISTTDTISNGYEYSEEFKVSASVEGSLYGMDVGLEASLTSSFTESVQTTYSTTTNQELSTTTQVTHDVCAHLPPESFTNVTQFVQQIHATVGYTNDVQYEQEIEVVPYVSTVGVNNHHTTLREVIALVNKAAGLLGVDLSDMFQNVITTASVTGKYKGKQGLQVSVDINSCSAADVNRSCTPEEALLYPPSYRAQCGSC